MPDMASLSIYFRNGDLLILGNSPKFTNAAYEALLNAEEEFVELGTMLDALPKYCIRRSEVIGLVVNPGDQTIFWHSANARSNQANIDFALTSRQFGAMQKESWDETSPADNTSS